MYKDNVFPYGDKKPVIGRNVFLDPSSRVIGDVLIDENSAVLYGAIIRGDEDKVIIGKNVAILENVIIEAPLGNPVKIGNGTLISHGAIVHGAKIGSGTLIGIGAIILDGSVVGDNSIVGAGAVITPHSVIPSFSLVLGIPGKVIKSVSEEDIKKVEEEVNRVLKKSLKYKEIFGRSKVIK